MYPSSDAVRAAVTGSHAAPVRVLLSNRTVLGSGMLELHPVDGEVKADSRQAVRRQLSMTLVDDGTLIPGTGKSLTPRDPRLDVLGPFSGSLIYAYRGIRTDSVDEMFPIGVFTPTQVTVSDSGSGPQIVVDADDASSLLMRPWTEQYVIAGGSNTSSALEQLLRDKGARRLEIAPSSFQTGRITFGTVGTESNPWQDAIALAQAAGMDLGMTANGTIRARDFADPDDPAVLRLAAGPGGVIVDGPTQVTAQGAAVNRVAVNVQNTDAEVPLTGKAQAAAGSPLDPAGPYGPNEASVDNSTILTQAQANAAAKAILSSVIGINIEVGVIPLPFLDVEDVVQVVDESIGMNLTGVVDTLTVPLSPDGVMALTVRTLGTPGVAG